MNDTIIPILQAGFAAHQAGELEIAAENYRHILGIDPKNPDALHLLGVVMMQKNNPSAAIDHMQRSLQIEPSNPDVLDHLGILLADQGDFQEAIDNFERALNISPDYSACWRNLGYTKELARDWSGAIAAYGAAIKFEPDYAAAHVSLGAVHCETGAFEDALPALNKALALEPDNHGALVKRADALLGLGYFDDAVAAYKLAFPEDTHQGPLHLSIAFCNVARGKDDKALEHFNAAIVALPESQDAHLGASACHMRNGAFDAAMEALQAVLATSPKAPLALAYKTILHNLLIEPAEASTISDLNHDISIQQLPIPPVFSNEIDFNKALVETLKTNSTLRDDPLVKSTRGGRQSGELSMERHPAVVGFLDSLKQALDDFLAGLKARPSHPHFIAIPKRYRLVCWSTILDAEGYQLPHIHPDGWLSGVYYVAVPPELSDNDPAYKGWIEFGASGYGLPAHDGPVRLVLPQEGYMVLFPSYFLHRTVPFQSATQRISIAFDLIPTD